MSPRYEALPILSQSLRRRGVTDVACLSATEAVVQQAFNNLLGSCAACAYIWSYYDTYLHIWVKRRLTTSLFEFPDVQATKASFLTMLDFRVDREFLFLAMDFVWIFPTKRNVPVIELTGVGVGVTHDLHENALESLKQRDFHHIRTQVNDLEQVISKLQRRDVKILMDVMAGAPGSGVEKVHPLRNRATISSNC
jgi:hypothetical protein